MCVCVCVCVFIIIWIFVCEYMFIRAIFYLLIVSVLWILKLEQRMVISSYRYRILYMATYFSCSSKS